ncbi:MAG: hypothetical protein GY772_11120 [bacterium]|nr:hypothetical protein [bacterium]
MKITHTHAGRAPIWTSTTGQYPLVWPAGTRWQEDPPTVVLEDSETVEPGMTVYGGGGYLYRDHVEQLSGSAVAEAAARCAGPTGEIAFFHIESDVDVVADPPRSPNRAHQRTFLRVRGIGTSRSGRRAAELLADRAELGTRKCRFHLRIEVFAGATSPSL